MNLATSLFADEPAAHASDAALPAMLVDRLVEEGFSPFFGTPCGILAPLFSRLQQRDLLMTVGREDSAVGLAAGAALAGRSPVVLMQNSGLGQSINALASLVGPYAVPMLLIVSLRGIPPDPTPENTVMGRATSPMLEACGIDTRTLGARDAADTVAWAAGNVDRRRRPTALLVPPTLFGWKA